MPSSAQARPRKAATKEPSSENLGTTTEVVNKYEVTTWGGNTQFQDITTPSGQTCQVRLPGVQRLMAAGILEDADTLSTLVDQKHIKRVGGKQKVDGQSLLADPKNLVAVMKTVDKIVEHMVVQPTVKRPVIHTVNPEGEPIERPIRDEDRYPDVVYTDQIDMTDRMYIFQFAVGGTTDVERFRGQLDEAMGSMEIK